MRFILASKSPGRLRTLQHAGIDPEVVVSGVDESKLHDFDPSSLALKLAELKGASVARDLEGDAILVACDSILEFDGRVRGKPGSAEEAAAQWRRIRGRQGVLHTGHFVWASRLGREQQSLRLASTTVRFADLDDGEIAAYVASGEPERVAGGFTIDGLGGAYVTAIDGDPHNVIGISLPLIRQVLLDLGIHWHELWRSGIKTP